MSEAPKIEIGTIWRDDLGGIPMVVVDTDETMIYVQRADARKKTIARGRSGAYIIARSEFANYRLIGTTRD